MQFAHYPSCFPIRFSPFAGALSARILDVATSGSTPPILEGELGRFVANEISSRVLNLNLDPKQREAILARARKAPRDPQVNWVHVLDDNWRSSRDSLSP